MRKFLAVLFGILLAMCLMGAEKVHRFEPYEVHELATKRLKKETDEALKLRVQLSWAERRLRDALREKQIDEVVAHYKRWKTFNTYGLSRPYIASWFVFADRWKYLAGKEGDIPLTEFMVGACIGSETNGDKKQFKVLEPDGSVSYGIANLNSSVLNHIDAILYKECPDLRNKDIKTDVEKSIAGKFVWIRIYKQEGKPWAQSGVNKWGWMLFDILRKTKL